MYRICDFGARHGLDKMNLLQKIGFIGEMGTPDVVHLHPDLCFILTSFLMTTSLGNLLQTWAHWITSPRGAMKSRLTPWNNSLRSTASVLPVNLTPRPSNG